MGLDYDYPTGGIKACAKEPLKVKLDNKHVGEIRKVKDGYQYYAKGQKSGGEIFNSVPDVQKSLLLTQPKKESKQKPVESGQDSEALTEDLRKARKKIDKLVEDGEQAQTLLGAAAELLAIQRESKEVVNLLEQSVNYNDTDCDGHTLLEDIINLLGQQLKEQILVEFNFDNRLAASFNAGSQYDRDNFRRIE